MRNVLLLALALFATAAVAEAQKFGYVNSQELLAELDEVKAAESDLVGFRDQQQKLLETKVQAFQTQLQELEQQNAEGLLTPKQIQEKQVEMQTKQQELQEMEASIQQKLVERREEKFQPIFDKVNAAIETVAQANDYQYVFDAAAGGVIVYADESMNITELVKTQLTAAN